WRLASMERALEAGFTLLGMGTLLGLFPYRFDVLALIDHAYYLRERYGLAPAVINVPRMRPALGAPLADAPHPVSDGALKHIIAVTRLAVPEASIAVSTREPPALREETLFLGASQLSAGSRTDPGGYHVADHASAEQFVLQDARPLETVIRALLRRGFLPDLYAPRCRGGGEADPYALPAPAPSPAVADQARALLALADYLEQRASPSTVELGLAGLQHHLAACPLDALRGHELLREVLPS
ncbi:MAG: [FeFe] hydrogenase H-cluster radical SAM maturase HydG, partial [Candidatus Tectimicrobiota bacterium]